MGLTTAILIIAILAYHHINGSAKMIKVFQTDQNISNFVPNSGALLVSEVPNNNMSSVTICFRFLVNQFMVFTDPPIQNLVEFDGKPAFGIYYDFKPPSDPTIQENLGSRWKLGSVFGYYFYNNKFSLFPLMSVLPRKWNNACFLSSQNYFKVFVNSHFIYEEHIQQEATHSNIAIMGTTKAQPEDTFIGSVFGKLTDFNLWNYNLNKKDILEWEKCGTKKGNIVDWGTSKWRVMNLKETLVGKLDLCKKEKKANLLMSNSKRNFDETLLLCNEIGKMFF